VKRTLAKITETITDELIWTYRKVRGRDHRFLNHAILALHKLTDAEAIVYSAARCLRNILDYHLCAFALYDREYNGGLDIWTVPGKAPLSLLQHIQEDFNIPDVYCRIHELDDAGELKASVQDPHVITVSYSVLEGKTQTRLYLLLRRGVHPYQQELISVLLQAIGTALQQCVHRARLEHAAHIDPLTNCYNRRALEDWLAQARASAERYQTDLSLLMLDIDFFKQINDRYGHSAGDAVLRTIPRCIRGAIRKSDYVARYGGEEFVVVLPETKLSKAIELAERLRTIVERVKIPFASHTLSVTASFGVAAFKPGMSQDDLIHKADEMLYEAKRQGRNRIAPDLKVYVRQHRPHATDTGLR